MAERIQSVERAALALRLIASSPRHVGLTELARAMGLPKGTLHGILATLAAAGLVEQEPRSGKYRLGAVLLHFGSRYLDVNELRSRSLHSADTLAARSGEAVWIGTPHESQVLVIHHVFRPDDSAQVLRVGALLPAHGTALGKVLLAFADAMEPPKTLPPATGRTITDAEELAAELDRVRERGWAASVEELTEGQAAVAAPIRDQLGAAVGAIGVSGRAERITEAGVPRPGLVAYVVEAAAEIGRALVG
ncbi:IclR family transcriptional regulator [Streptomyces sp. B1866]|uniref:IclR family transcriptional regulator n=1 Tax=Streptomyces sp. B1866 TaxID=3075431 RepID=UPI0028919AA7|nr:IclR family transcriptional regulator [Streptomyces sp. B1866]MDT3399378.1 IclR family transcriptional regulator [Streptomyces sp. B1866]